MHRKNNDFEHVHDGKKYLLVNNMKKDYFDAREHCQRIGGDLASILDEDENSEINEVILTGKKDQSTFWAGGEAKGDGTWGWVDGSEWSYENFSKEIQLSGKCIELNEKDKTWSGVECEKKNHYVCKIGAEERQNRFVRINAVKREAEEIRFIEEQKEIALVSFIETNEKAY